MRIVFISVVCCYSGESGSNSGFRIDFRGFKFGFLRFFWVSAMLIAIRMNIDRDQDEHKKKLIAIKMRLIAIFQKPRTL